MVTAMISNRDRLASALLSTVADQHWLTKAACSPETSEMWFPLRGHNSTNQNEDSTAAQAIRICWTECPVRQQCLEWAVANRETDGLWGGMWPGQRYEWARTHNVAPPRALPVVQPVESSRLRTLRRMAAAGCTVETMAAYFQVTPRTVHRWFDQAARAAERREKLAVA